MKTHSLPNLAPRHEDIGVVEVQLYTFLTSELDVGEWSASRPGGFIPGVRVPDTHWIGGCLGHRAGLYAVAKRKRNPPMPGIEPRSYIP
jgi:hypothetical protein